MRHTAEHSIYREFREINLHSQIIDIFCNEYLLDIHAGSGEFTKTIDEWLVKQEINTCGIFKREEVSLLKLAEWLTTAEKQARIVHWYVKYSSWIW